MFVKGFRQRERIRPEIGIDLEADASIQTVTASFARLKRHAARNKNGRHRRPSLKFAAENSVRKRIRAPWRNPAAA